MKTLDRFCRRGEMRYDDTEILLQSGLLCAAESNSSMGMGFPLFYIVHQVLLRTASTSTSVWLALENSLAQRVVPNYVSKPSQLWAFGGRK
ncbi:hypothetical protein DPMN_054018 [Dreissena polymorpha]|uniref:Uncharacterized protein n=1 Tax=Dreissena polymorpha TaxID=45954 RepID=A0A9D4CNR1_DREPO|nr:hypothetical protein DPMN_054018 [Dreissena polymorpha]